MSRIIFDEPIESAFDLQAGVTSKHRSTHLQLFLLLALHADARPFSLFDFLQARVQEKWAPVFRPDAPQIENSERDDNSKKVIPLP